MKNVLLIPLLIFAMSSCAQYNNFDEMATKMANGDVSIIKVSELSNSLKKGEKIVLLDAREIEEYNVSHIENSKFVGYDNFNKKNIQGIPKDSKVVVYCSVGYRSCKIGEKLQDMGYSNVYNLYGGMFDWVNNGNTIVDNDNKPTNKVHAYNKDWGKWVTKGEKVY